MREEVRGKINTREKVVGGTVKRLKARVRVKSGN